MTGKTTMPAIHLLWAFSTFALGGAQRRFLSLADALGPAYRHSVFAMDGCLDAARSAPHLPLDLIEGCARKGALISRANLSMMRDMLGARRPDLLLTSNWGAVEWIVANTGARAVPHIHFEDGFGPDERPDAQNPKRLWARRVLFRKPGLHCVAPSQVLADVYREDWRLPAARLHLIPNGVDCARFDVAPCSGAARSGTPVIGTVAALRPEKRIDRLIDAFAHAAIPGATLLIVGDGPERAALEARGVPGVEFAGAQDDVAPFLARMTHFAMSSDTEQMPISLVEAMAAGLPVAATDVGDTRAMLTPGNRPFVTPREDTAALAQSLATLAADPALSNRLGTANQAKAREAYSLDAMAATYDALFRARIGPGAQDARAIA